MTSKTPRRIALAVAALAATGGTVLATAGVAVAGTVDAETCTSFTGTQLIHPGYAKGTKSEKVTLTGTISGCTDEFGDPQPGNGTVVATLTGSGNKKSATLSGSVTINWPASTGLEPTTGSLSVAGSPTVSETVTGETTGGAYVGNYISSSIVTTSTTKHEKAIVASQFTNSSNFTLSHNGG